MDDIAKWERDELADEKGGGKGERRGYKGEKRGGNPRGNSPSFCGGQREEVNRWGTSESPEGNDGKP
eukprot:2670542-Karenia_brevis.AAC.1